MTTGLTYLVSQICFPPATSFPPWPCTALRILPSQCSSAGKGDFSIFQTHKYTQWLIWEQEPLTMQFLHSAQYNLSQTLLVEYIIEAWGESHFSIFGSAPIEEEEKWNRREGFRSPTAKNVQHLKEGEVRRVAGVSKGWLEQRHTHRRTARGEQVGGRE